MFKFCPNCAKETVPGWKCCPYCGFKFEEVGYAAPEATSAGSDMDSMLGNLFGFAKNRQTDSKLRTLIIRGMYDEAKEICNTLIDNDPMDKVGYIGLIRIASKNYKEYEGAEIAEQIRIAEEIFGGVELLSDSEYAKYIAAYKQYFEEKERKAEEKRAEAERKRREAEKAEAERRRAEQIAAERAEEERRRIEEERAEAERTLILTKSVMELRDKSGASILDCRKALMDSDGNMEKATELLRKRGLSKSNKECDFEIENGILKKYYGRCQNLIIPSNVRIIRREAFDSECIRIIESLEIPNSMTEIEKSTFSDWGNLKRVKISNSVTKIGMFAFSNCKKLEYVELPTNVKLICASAFHGCNSLKSVVVSKDCVFGSGAFPYGCKIIER